MLSCIIDLWKTTLVQPGTRMLKYQCSKIFSAFLIILSLLLLILLRLVTPQAAKVFLGHTDQRDEGPSLTFDRDSMKLVIFSIRGSDISQVCRTFRRGSTSVLSLRRCVCVCKQRQSGLCTGNRPLFW